MLALSIVAPHGRHIAEGRKWIEVRSWPPSTWPLRDLVIVENGRFLSDAVPSDKGHAVAIVDVLEVRPWRPEDVVAACSTGWVPGYFAWVLGRVRPITPPRSAPALRKLYALPDDLLSD